MTSQPLLEMKSVRVKRGDSQIFSQFDLSLPSDRSSAILGPNGCGKSTLLKLISRELYPMPDPATEFKILGRSNWRVEELRQSMSLVSQDLQSRILQDSTVLQVVVSEYYSSITTWAHQRYSAEQLNNARVLLQQMEIGHLQGRQFQTLSTGQQRRCLLARALVKDPEFLIFDEPTTALDIKASYHYLEIMERLIEQGKKLVLVTHHLNEIPPQVDWFVFLKAGKVVAQGARKELVTAENISALFDMPIALENRKGYCHAITH